MAFADVIRRMVAAVERGDGQGVANCFTPDGVYHDVFYGSFEQPRIAEMIEGYFYRDGRDFKWDIHDPVEQDGIGYARYVFSYASTLPGAEGKRGLFEGVAVCRMRDGLIADYREIANAATGLFGTGFPPERLAKFIGKQHAELAERGESERHRP
ncbi:MAG: nuclear transport factor 2 family protein [Hyphomicrobiaceae bacterium]|nr:nuclear transport factor 2 family protein [Hyphomicrobiaceae bacterium]